MGIECLSMAGESPTRMVRMRRIDKLGAVRWVFRAINRETEPWYDGFRTCRSRTEIDLDCGAPNAEGSERRPGEHGAGHEVSMISLEQSPACHCSTIRMRPS
jgi:hypothetical protein